MSVHSCKQYILVYDHTITDTHCTVYACGMSKAVTSYIHVDGSYAVQLACPVCKTSEKNDKCMQLVLSAHTQQVKDLICLYNSLILASAGASQPHATGYDEAFCTHFNQFVHKIMHRYADREVRLCCMHNICCTSVTSDFLPDGEGSG